MPANKTTLSRKKGSPLPPTNPVVFNYMFGAKRLQSTAPVIPMAICAAWAVFITLPTTTAAATVTYSGSITNNGPNPSHQYTAEYAATCDAATTNSYATAATACAGLGSGWTFAAVPSAAAQTAIATLAAGANIWLGGTDSAVEGEWRWTHGRLTNALFYKGQYTAGTCMIPPCTCESGAYCNWRITPAEPNDDSANEDYMGMAPSGWNDVPTSASLINCAACERSLCDITLDCNAANTLSVDTSKYFVFGEPCGCVCKDGFTGSRCDTPIVPVNTGPYTAEYGVTCNTATINSYASAATACSSLGSGWALATIPSAVAQTAIAALSTTTMWLAGSDAAVEGEWRWTHGRLTNALFFKGQYNSGGTCAIPPCTCEGGAYCNWYAVSYEPRNDLGDEDHVVMLTSSFASRPWNDVPASVPSFNCAACERSLCDITLDCNAANTLSVNTSKYFVFGEPCGCVCKDGFTGPRCDTPIVPVNTGTYTAEFGVTCNTATINSYATAVTACAGLGSGWALATVPSAVAQTAIAAISTDRIWLAGSDSAVEGEWRWTHGRLTNALFYKGQYNAGGTCTIPPCSCEGGAYCNWKPAPAEPNDELGVEDYVVMTPFSSTPLRQWNDVPGSATTVTCAACERSFCDVNVDCNVANTLSVNTSKYFVFGEPCGCVCKDGFSGPRCDDAAPVVTVNGAYVSQFMGECASQPLSWTDAAARCSGRGSGWGLATINSAAVQTTVAALTPGLATWIGGNDLAASDVFVWQFGRLKGETLYTGRKSGTVCTTGPCASPPGMYSNFAATQPDDAAGLESYMVMFGGTKTWNDGPLFYATTRCYACERSPCLDVAVASAAAAALVAAGGSTSGLKFSAYYPNCTATVSPSISSTVKNTVTLSALVSPTASVAVSTSHSPSLSKAATVSVTSSSSRASTASVTTHATASIQKPKTATMVLPPPPSATTTTPATTTTTSAIETSTSESTSVGPATAFAATTTAATSVSETTSSTTTSGTSASIASNTATTANATPSTSSANCSAASMSDIAVTTEATLVLFPSTSSASGAGNVLVFPLSASIDPSLSATASNAPFTLVWNVTTATAGAASSQQLQLQGAEALAQALRDYVVMFVQCTAQTSLFIRCSLPVFAIPDAAVAAAPVRVTMTAAVSSAVSLTPPMCPPATTTLRLVATIIVAPPAAGGDDTGAASVVLRVALAAAGAATTAFAILVEPWALEPLLLVGVLDGPCAGLGGLQDIARYAVYSLNPFVPLTNDSPSTGGLLLILLVGIVTAANAGIAFARTSSTTSTSDVPRWRRAFGTALFPRVAFSVAVAAVPGVSWALANTIREHAASSTSSTQALLFIVLGAVYVVLVPAVGALAIFRAVPATFVVVAIEQPQHLQRRHSDFSSAVRQWARRLATPAGFYVLVVPVPYGASSGPSAALLLVPPSSSSLPPVTMTNQQLLPAALNLRGVTAGPRGGSLLFAGSALLSIAVFAITAAPPLSSSCAARHYVAAAILMLTAVLVAAVRPHRTPLATILTAALLTLIGLCVSLVGAAAAEAVAAQNTQSTTTTPRNYTIAVFALALLAILVSVGRTVHALWLWRTYDRNTAVSNYPAATEGVNEDDTNEMKLVMTAN